MMDRVPGTEVARILFDEGLWFDGVVRGLMRELEFSEHDARDAARAALAERLAVEVTDR